MDYRLKRKATSLAFKLLTRRNRTGFELRQYLIRKGINDEIADSVLDSMIDYGYINDLEYSRCWVRSKLSGRGFLRLRYDLRGKGVCRDTIDQVFDEYGFSSEYECALKLIEKKNISLNGSGSLKKTLRVLSRRGYSYDVINRICLNLLDN